MGFFKAFCTLRLLPSDYRILIATIFEILFLWNYMAICFGESHNTD